jgi:hypothetical protein
MGYLSGQGEVFQSARDGNGNPGDYGWVGNAPSFELNLGTETLTHKESYSGNRATDARITTELTTDLSVTMQDIKEANFNLLAYGTASAVSGGSITGEAVLATVPVVGEHYSLKATGRVSAVTLKGNAVTISSTKYSIDASGSIVFTDVSGIVAPITADYTNAASRQVGLFKTGAPEQWVRLLGKNTAQSVSSDFARYIIDVFKTRFDPGENMQFIGDEFNEFVLKGSALVDSTKSQASATGQFARFIYLDTQ